MIIPRPLTLGSKVAILSPASAINPELVSLAAFELAEHGFSPVIMPHACGRHGSYSGSFEERLADFQAALADPEVKAILCSRGGYGCVHLLGHISPRPVWLIGFSDVSALHALWFHSGVCSIHGSMAKELALKRCPSNLANQSLLQILTTGKMPLISWEADPLNRVGEATGVLVGGNLAVLDGLAATPFDTLGLTGSILVIEDIAEPIYKVERIMYRLRLSGAFDRIAGLVVGQFTDYCPDQNGETMDQMVARMVAPYSFPVAFKAPIGHVDGNLPWLHGSLATLAVTPTTSSLQ